jgi:RNA polymerase sigma factor (sigma-70 family)
LPRRAHRLNLFLAHRASLVDYATPIVGDRARAEDLVQEAFLRFAPPGEEPPGEIEQPLAYLYRIVRNLALDWTRRRTMEHRRQQAEPPWWAMPETPRTPEQELAHARDIDLVAAALEELPRDARIAVEMHRFGGHTLGEIADRLGVSVPTAHRLVRDALLRIARRLEARGNG